MANDGENPRSKGPSCLGIVLVLAVAVGAILWTFWPSDAEMQAQRDTALASAPIEEVTPDSFREAYRSNEAAAKLRFDDKAIRMTGTVAGVRESKGSALVVSFASADGVGVETSVDADNRAKALALKAGDTATVEWSRLLDVTGARVLAQCRLK